MRPLSFNGLSRSSLFGPLVQLQANFVNFLSAIIKELDAKDFLKYLLHTANLMLFPTYFISIH